MIIAKHFEFEAAHQLPDIECYGACRNLHGHTYKLTIEIKGSVNDKGWIINFKDLKVIVNRQVISKLDHSNINNFVPVSTAENILTWMAGQLSELNTNDYKLYSLTLYETSNSYAKLICE